MPIALSNEHVEATGDDIMYPPSSHDESSMDIAIIGMACRLPGHVSNLESFWDLCLTARDTWSEVPKERFSQEHFYHPNPDQTNCVSPGPLWICQKNLLNDLYSGTRKEVTSFPKILHASTPSFSTSRPRKPRRWTRNSGSYWNAHMRH